MRPRAGARWGAGAGRPRRGHPSVGELLARPPFIHPSLLAAASANRRRARGDCGARWRRKSRRSSGPPLPPLLPLPPLPLPLLLMMLRSRHRPCLCRAWPAAARQRAQGTGRGGGEGNLKSCRRLRR
eukprot:scaffold2437_cov395-Prasinococcus_capsulatus_cf.AAC.6